MTVPGPLNWDRRKVVERHLGASIADLPGSILPSQYRADLKVDQLRRRQLLAA